MKKIAKILTIGILAATSAQAYGGWWWKSSYYNNYNKNRVFISAQQTNGYATNTQLTEEQKEGLKHMVEEEKLARDVYLTLYNKWHSRVFANISRSEQRHMNAIKYLLKKYGVDDPTVGKDVGEFEDPNMRNLFEALVAKGSKSLKDAMEVGKQIEELDIEDLDKEIAGVKDHSDIVRVYSNLKRGSYHHLRAFNFQLYRFK